MATSLRASVSPRQAGIILLGVGLVCYGIVGLFGGSSPFDTFVLVALVTAVAFAGVLLGSRMS